MNDTDARIVEAVRATTFSALREGFTVEEENAFRRRGYLATWDAYCCVAASRVAYDVLRSFFIAVKPLKVMTRFYSKAAWEWLQGGEQGDPPTDAKIFATGTVEGQAVAGDGMLNGHVVLVVENELLLDCSAEQFSHPDHGMPMESLTVPLTTPLGRAFLRDDEPLAVGDNNTGNVLIYVKHPDLTGVYNAPDWNPRTHDRQVITEKVRQAVERGETYAALPKG